MGGYKILYLFYSYKSYHKIFLIRNTAILSYIYSTSQQTICFLKSTPSFCDEMGFTDFWSFLAYCNGQEF